MFVITLVANDFSWKFEQAVTLNEHKTNDPGSTDPRTALPYFLRPRSSVWALYLPTKSFCRATIRTVYEQTFLDRRSTQLVCINPSMILRRLANFRAEVELLSVWDMEVSSFNIKFLGEFLAQTKSSELWKEVVLTLSKLKDRFKECAELHIRAVSPAIMSHTTVFLPLFRNKIILETWRMISSVPSSCMCWNLPVFRSGSLKPGLKVPKGEIAEIRLSRVPSL